MERALQSRLNPWVVLLVVFAGIVAAIAVPNLKLARMTANESYARTSLRTINAAELKFIQLNPAKGYACSLTTLSEARLISDQLASGLEKGYKFEISDCGLENPNGVYRVSAQPVAKNHTGYWVFCTDQTARIKGSPTSREDCFNVGVERPLAR